jgi:hypothetical protein
MGLFIEKSKMPVTSCFSRIEERRLVVYAIHAEQKSFTGLSWWAADLAIPTAYLFREIPLSQQLSVPLSAVKTRGKRNAPERIVIIRDKVNLRSNPRMGTVRKVLRIGTIAELIEKKGPWSSIHLITGIDGWVSSLFISDSISMGKTRWAQVTGLAQKPVVPDPGLPGRVIDPAFLPVQGASTSSSAAASDDGSAYQQKNILTGISPYRVYGRDPYIPLTDYNPDENTLPDVENSLLVGVLYDARDRVALIEVTNKKQAAFALREGEPVLHGRLRKITPASALFLIEEAGVYRQFVLTMRKKK